jgi:hypothetical protein
LMRCSVHNLGGRLREKERARPGLSEEMDWRSSTKGVWSDVGSGVWKRL